MVNKNIDFIKVYIEMKALSPVFSSGETLEMANNPPILGSKRYVPMRTTADGRILVPLKGKLRMATEKILRAKGEKICDLDQDVKGCGKCKACDIFGSMSKRGRWSVGNLISKDFAEDIAGTYTHLKTKRSSMTMDPKKIYNLEEVNAGAVFFSEIFIFNPKPDDEELLIASLNLLKYLGVGGLMTRGYGRLELIKYEKQEFSYIDFLNNTEKNGGV